MKKTILAITLIFFCTTAAVFAQKTITIARLDSMPSIDGILEPGEWDNAPEVADFSTTLPQFGNQPQSPTSVRMGYTDRGIFIAAVCRSAGKVRNDGAARDSRGSGDYFTAGFDTWNDDQNAYLFTVTAGGQITDERVSSTAILPGYNTPWRARTAQQADGWTVEIWIPFTALRYPTKGSQNWGVQFTRFDRSTGETSTWSPRDPVVQGNVIQYGTMEGLVTPAKQIRLGLSVLQQNKYSDNYYSNVFYPNNQILSEINLGVDGRVGFNSATTLDFSILPAVNFINNSVLKSPGNYINRTLNNYPNTLPNPRVLEQEELGVAIKSPWYWADPVISIADMLGNVSIQPDENIRPQTGSRIVQEARFNTRTRSNIGISVINDVFSRPTFYISVPNIDLGNDRIEKYGFNPMYNLISVEKALRNNSWIQASTSNLIIGKGLNTNNSTLSTQLRDKSNRFEAGGHFITFTQMVEKGSPYTRAQGDAHIGKVSGKYTWNIAYTSPINGYQGVLESPFRSSYAYFNLHQITAKGSIQNYHPGQSWLLNTRQSLQVRTYQGNVPGYLDRWSTSYDWSGLSANFQSMRISITATPVIRQETLKFNTLTLLGKKSIPANMMATASTDTRKKTILNYGAGFNWDPYYWQFNPVVQLSPSWVFHKKAALQITNTVTLPGKGNYNTGISDANYIFERSTNWGFQSGASFYFYPSRKWTLQGHLAYSTDRLENRKAYEVLDNGTRVETPFPFESVSDNQLFNAGFSLDWNYSSVQHVSLGLSHTRGENSHLTHYQSISNFFSIPNNNYSTTLQCSWVWNLNNQQK